MTTARYTPELKRRSVERTLLRTGFRSLHAKRINKELRQAGAVLYNMLLPETHFLPDIIHPDEHVRAAVYGRYQKGRGVLVATDSRVLFIDKKPLFMHVDEIDYDTVGGVTRTEVWPAGYVTLHTQVGDFRLRTFNNRNARNFTEFVEDKCLHGSTLPVSREARHKVPYRDSQEL